MQTFIKFLGSDDRRLELHDKITNVIETSHCHYGVGFSLARMPKSFRSSDSFYLARMTKDPNDYAIFGKATIVEYDHRRDQATEKDIEILPWKSKWPCILRLCNPIFVQGRLRNCVLMSSILAKFGVRSFVKTNARFLAGEVNINPKQSLSQQAFIELTSDAGIWLDQKFENAIVVNGYISEEYLTSLPQPQVIFKCK